MAKFYSENEWLSNSQESKNPWSTSSTYIDVGSLGKVIYLAEQTREIPKVCVCGSPACLTGFNSHYSNYFVFGSIGTKGSGPR